jgi:pimeloyl-ACP methyl ester carboxylesterase
MKKDIFKLVAIGVLLFCTGFVLKSVGISESTAEAAPEDIDHMTFMTDDGLTLHAWLSPATTDPEAKNLPGLALLFPMMSKTHESFEPFIKQLNDIGYATIAFDLRGHGLSTQIGKKAISYDAMNENQFGKMPGDIEQFFRDFKENHRGAYNYNDVVVIGASIGANTAGLLLTDDRASRAVLLSPGRNYRGLRPEMSLAADSPLTKPLYIAVSDSDTYSAESSQWLYDHYAGPKTLKSYPGRNHGTDILVAVPDADKDLLEWLRAK